MIGKIGRGHDTAGLIRYLLGPGRANEHTDPRVIAAWDDDAVRRPVVAEATSPRAAARHWADLLDQPLALLPHRRAEPAPPGSPVPSGARATTPTVWHCSLRAAPADPLLSDAQWAGIARDVLDATGLAPRGDADGCRWVVVRHADDHVHLAVTLARQDGRAARAAHDYARVGAACRAAEVRLGLRVTPPRDSTAPRRLTRAEVEKAHRQGHPEPPRLWLRRQVRRAALDSTDLPGFLALLAAAGVEVRLRYSEADPAVVTGYAVAATPAPGADGGLVWFGGGRLAPQLSLPRLTAAWSRRPTEQLETTTATTHRPRARPVRSTIQASGRAAGALRGAAAAAVRLEHGDVVGAAVSAATSVVRGIASRRRR